MPAKHLAPAIPVVGGAAQAVAPYLAASPSSVFQGQQVVFTLTPTPVSTDPDPNYGPQPVDFTQWNIAFGANQVDPTTITQDPTNLGVFTWDTTGVVLGTYNASLTVTYRGKSVQATSQSVNVNLRPIGSGDVLPVTMMRSAETPTSDEALWVAIRASSNALSFENYVNFVDRIMCCPGSLDSTCKAPPSDDCAPTVNGITPPPLPPLGQRRFLPFPNMDAYRVLKVATECFLMMNCGVYLSREGLKTLVTGNSYDPTDDASRLGQNASTLPDQVYTWWGSYLNATDPQNLLIPYLALVRERLGDLPLQNIKWGSTGCYGILKRKLTHPCLIELIWSYWQEEGMLVQVLNAISRRFQNLRAQRDRDPLERFDIDPLRALNSLLWGYVQDEQHRLTLVRRAYEYNHEYGLTLEGKALRALRPSDSRSKFLEAFHNLLYLCTIFFKEDDDTTVVADGFPVLNALREVHYILAAGAHNQFGELPSTARQEMLMQQWLLARPEMREFLGGKIMVPYPEEWMDRADSVKSMFGWSDVSVIYFRDLAVYGEQIVLSARYGAWSIVTNPAQAANWARYWRPEIQAYIHAYRAATGVDLTTEPVNATLPSVLLLKRLATQRPALTR